MQPETPRLASRFVQVAGVLSLDEALMIAELGVDYIGIPLRLDVHQPDVSEVEAKRIFRGLPTTTRGVVITYENEPEVVDELCRDLGVSIVQLHGDATPGNVARLRSIRPELIIIKSIVVTPPLEELLTLGRSYERHVDAFIVDSYDPDSGARGATGRTHDWNVSRAIVEGFSVPVILAGGLHPGNVAEAIAQVRPAGVDAHTGLEDATGRKKAHLVRSFVDEAHRAFAAGDK